MSASTPTEMQVVTHEEACDPAFGLCEQGFDIEERKEFMGHEDIRTTERYYGRVTIEDVAAKIAELGL